jgi:hypothetical protein
MTDHNPNDPTFVLPEVVTRLPLSAQQVFTVLYYEGPLTQQGIVAFGVQPRTTRNAIAELRDVDAIRERPYPHDARQSLFEPVVPDE